MTGSADGMGEELVVLGGCAVQRFLNPPQKGLSVLSGAFRGIMSTPSTGGQVTTIRNLARKKVQRVLSAPLWVQKRLSLGGSEERHRSRAVRIADNGDLSDEGFNNGDTVIPIGIPPLGPPIVTHNWVVSISITQ